MKRTRLLLLPALLASVFLCGCIIPIPVPGKEEVSPEISGRIIDGKTKQPVVGAQVQVGDLSSKKSGSNRKPRPSMLTDSEGRFKLSADKRFYMMSYIMIDERRFPSTGGQQQQITISHSDYETLTVDFYLYVVPGGEKGKYMLRDIEIVTKQ